MVNLALHQKLWVDKASITLAGWEERASLAAAADPTTSAEVLGYFVSLDNLRPCLVPALAENPSVGEESVKQLAVLGSRSVVEVLLTSKRVMSSPRLLKALQSNAHLRPNELAEIANKPAALETCPVAEPTEADAPDEVLEVTVTKYLEENAAELAAEKDKPFKPVQLQREEIAHEHARGEAAADVRRQADAGTGGATVDAPKSISEESATAPRGQAATD